MVNKKFMKNVFINIISAGLLTGVTQLLVFPIISSELSTNSFGLMVTIHGFHTLIMNVVGNSMNNIRLVYNDRIEEKGLFKILLYLSLAFSVILSYILYTLYGIGINELEKLFLIILTLLGTLRVYLIVYFRIDFEYEKILYTNLIMAFGYVIGIVFFIKTKLWWLIFLIGEFFGLVYLINKSKFLLEKSNLSKDFKPLLKETFSLMFSNGITSGLSYLDRFLITPIISSAAMSIYFAVSIFSKIINMLVVPINNVLLSYLSRIKIKDGRKYLIIINVVFSIVLIPAYFFMNFITPYLLSLFYPHLLEKSLPYIAIVNIATIFKLLSTVTNTFILKLHKMKYQVIIKIIYGLTYIVLAIFLSISRGLMGFALATVISYFLHWILLLSLGLLTPSTSIT